MRGQGDGCARRGRGQRGFLPLVRGERVPRIPNECARAQRRAAPARDPARKASSPPRARAHDDPDLAPHETVPSPPTPARPEGPAAAAGNRCSGRRTVVARGSVVAARRPAAVAPWSPRRLLGYSREKVLIASGGRAARELGAGRRTKRSGDGPAKLAFRTEPRRARILPLHAEFGPGTISPAGSAAIPPSRSGGVRPPRAVPCGEQAAIRRAVTVGGRCATKKLPFAARGVCDADPVTPAARAQNGVAAHAQGCDQCATMGSSGWAGALARRTRGVPEAGARRRRFGDRGTARAFLAKRGARRPRLSGSFVVIRGSHWRRAWEQRAWPPSGARASCCARRTDPTEHTPPRPRAARTTERTSVPTSLSLSPLPPFPFSFFFPFVAPREPTRHFSHTSDPLLSSRSAGPGGSGAGTGGPW